MKKYNFVLLITSALFICISCCFKKDLTPIPSDIKSVIIQPVSEDGVDAVIWYIQDQTTQHGATNTTNFGYDTELPTIEWTFSGSPGHVQSLIQFDLSTIPAPVTITSAQLTLFDCADCIDDSLGVETQVLGYTNSVFIQRITSA
jgi:hypothetical protein